MCRIAVCRRCLDCDHDDEEESGIEDDDIYVFGVGLWVLYGL